MACKTCATQMINIDLITALIISTLRDCNSESVDLGLAYTQDQLQISKAVYRLATSKATIRDHTASSCHPNMVNFQMAQIIIRICAKADGFRDILAKLLAAAQIEIANELSCLKLKSYKLPLIDSGLERSVFQSLGTGLRSLCKDSRDCVFSKSVVRIEVTYLRVKITIDYSAYV